MTTTAFGNPGVPGIWSEPQVEGWRQVVDAVHAKGAVIFLQLWHVGRVSLSSFRPGGALPVAPLAVAIPHEFKAMTAGFDGVEIHGANGYLIEHFLQSRSKLSTDQYGGSIKNRVRLLLEIMRRSRSGARTASV